MLLTSLPHPVSHKPTQQTTVYYAANGSKSIFMSALLIVIGIIAMIVFFLFLYFGTFPFAHALNQNGYSRLNYSPHRVKVNVTQPLLTPSH